MKRKSRKKIISLLLFWIAFALILVLLYFFVYERDILNLRSESNDQTGINYDKPTEEQTQAGNDVKKQTIDQSKQTNTSTGEKTETTLTLSSSSVSNGVLHIRVLIDAVTADGTCTLTLTSPNEKIVKQAAVYALPHGSTCQGFDIPTSELHTSNSWDATINLDSPLHTGQLSQQIKIEEQKG